MTLSPTSSQQSQQHRPVSLRKDVEQVATLAHPTRPEGERFFVTKALAEKNKVNGWAK
jgi:hypothetical protein